MVLSPRDDSRDVANLIVGEISIAIVYASALPRDQSLLKTCKNLIFREIWLFPRVERKKQRGDEEEEIWEIRRAVSRKSIPMSIWLFVGMRHKMLHLAITFA